MNTAGAYQARSQTGGYTNTTEVLYPMMGADGWDSFSLILAARLEGRLPPPSIFEHCLNIGRKTTPHCPFWFLACDVQDAAAQHIFQCKAGNAGQCNVLTSNLQQACAIEDDKCCVLTAQ